MEQQYNLAKDLYMHSAETADIEHARDIFISLGDYERAADYAAKCELRLQYEVGRGVTFGAFEGKPIQWHVYDQRGKMRLLIADEIVCHHPYHDTLTDAMWSDCSLRKYLNGPFLKECFNPREMMMIVPTHIQNLRSEKWFSNGGPDTMDRVFIPDTQEMNRFWPDPESRKLGGWWWIRNPGSNLCSAVAVYEDGTDYDFGINVHYKDGGVRPALWVLLRI